MKFDCCAFFSWSTLRSAASTGVRWVKLHLPSLKQNARIRHDIRFCNSLPQYRANAEHHRTALVRLDEIGDYIIFRQSLAAVRTHPKLANTELWLIGNEAWKNLSETWDSSIFDKFFWINKSKFFSDETYRRATFSELRAKGFHRVICPSFQRNPTLEDAIVRACGSPENIGWRAPLSSFAPGIFARSMQLYATAVVPETAALHERERGMEFWQELFRQPGWQPQAPINLHFLTPSPTQSNPSHNVVFVPGANAKSRRWPPQYFAALAKLLTDRCSGALIFHIVGSGKDAHLAKSIVQSETSLRWNDLTGKTTLNELSTLLAEAALVVSNDTGAAHLATYHNTPLLVLASGNNWGRFFPVAKELQICLPTPTFQNILSKKSAPELHGWLGSTNIAEISPHDAFHVIHKHNLLRRIPQK